MSQMLEVIYEDEVLKPLTPVKGIEKHEKAWVILSPHSKKKSLHELVGTLSRKEAEEMQKVIDGEFEKTERENEW